MLQKTKKMKTKIYYRLSIQVKLMLIFLFTSAIIFVVNIYLYMNLNGITESIDRIYTTNIILNDLQNELGMIQANVTEYLNTKSSESMESYFRSEQNYNRMINELNNQIINNEIQIMEKNIRNISEYYLEITNSTIEAKRGRNIEKCKILYDESSKLYNYLDVMIYSLNNKQFQKNSGNYGMFLDSLEYSELVNMGILIVASILNCILIILLTRGITKPLKRLADAAYEVAEGNLNIVIKESKTKDEISVVTKAFNQMVQSLKKHIERLKESMESERAMKEKELMMESHLKDARLKYLQAQINPHFLFNTLNAGAQLAMMEEAKKSYKYIQNVSEFFRYMLKQSKDAVPLNEEIKLVDNYIYILNVRFSNEIIFIKEIDNSLTDINVPIMILQPIVENAVNYGIRNINHEGRITLSVYEESESVCISISDNGVGISKEKINAIMNSQLRKSDLGENSNGIGLDNVIGRLRLFYGKHDVFEITSEGENMGTEIAIHIPLSERSGTDV